MSTGKMSFAFKENTPFEERLTESSRIKQKYPTRIPIICERFTKSSIQNIDKVKFLVPNELTIGQFIFVIRKRLKVSPETAIYVIVDTIYPSSSTSISTLYDMYKDEDGFLYLKYSGENTFGSHLIK